MNDLDNTDLENNKAEDAVAEQQDANNLENIKRDAVLQQEIDELKDKVLRVAADYENAKRRHEKQLEEAKDYAIASFSKDLMSVMDNLSRALEHAPSDIDDMMKNFILGVEMTKSELTRVFEKHHIESVVPNIGDKFDYNMHHAILQVPTEEHPQGTILQVMQAGYKIKDRLIRPATVSVSKAQKE